MQSQGENELTCQKQHQNELDIFLLDMKPKFGRIPVKMFHIEKVEQVFRQHPCGDTHAEIFSKRHIAMSKRKYMLIIALIFSTIAGCSSKRDWRVIGKPVDYTFRQEKEGLTVAIEPWTRSKDIRALFKKNIGNRTLALKIVMFNHGENTIRFSSTQAKLCLADGRTSSVVTV